MSLPVTESFLLTITGGGFGFLGAFLVCLLKSRCTTIRCCCISCDRDVLPPNMVENAIENNIET